MNFKTGKIRRNAHRMIDTLLNNATAIYGSFSHREIDDSFHSSDFELVSKETVTNWIANRRTSQHTNIYLTCDDNNQPVELIVDGSYWEDSFKLTFQPVELHESNESLHEMPLSTHQTDELMQNNAPSFEEEKQEVTITDNHNHSIQFTATLALSAHEIMVNNYSDTGTSSGVITACDFIKSTFKSFFHVEPITPEYTKLLSVDGEYYIRHESSELQQLVIDEQLQNKAALTPTSPTRTRLTESLGDYQNRIDSKRERLEDRAAKARNNSNVYYLASKERASHIPFGQPILVGHHSEKRCRRDAERIYNDMGKSVAEDKKAARLETRAASIGKNGISSDDPEAITKLMLKLESLTRSQEIMKQVNAMIKKATKNPHINLIDSLIGIGLNENQATQIIEPDHMGRIGFASYSLSNNNSEIRRIKDRIAELEKLHNSEPIEFAGDGWEIFEDDGRVQVRLDTKPDKETCAILRSHGFVYSPTRETSVRKITSSAIYAASELATLLQAQLNNEN